MFEATRCTHLLRDRLAQLTLVVILLGMTMGSVILGMEAAWWGDAPHAHDLPTPMSVASTGDAGVLVAYEGF